MLKTPAGWSCTKSYYKAYWVLSQAVPGILIRQPLWWDGTSRLSLLLIGAGLWMVCSRSHAIHVHTVCTLSIPFHCIPRYLTIYSQHLRFKMLIHYLYLKYHSKIWGLPFFSSGQCTNVGPRLGDFRDPAAWFSRADWSIPNLPRWDSVSIWYIYIFDIVYRKLHTFNTSADCVNILREPSLFILVHLWDHYLEGSIIYRHLTVW